MGGAWVLIGCLGHRSRTFSALKLLLAHFVFFFSFAYTNHLTHHFRLTIRPRLEHDGSIDRKFNEEQLLLETFSLKMHVERHLRQKIIFKFIPGVKTSIKKAPGRGRVDLICCLGYHSRTFSAS